MIKIRKGVWYSVNNTYTASLTRQHLLHCNLISEIEKKAIIANYGLSSYLIQNVFLATNTNGPDILNFSTEFDLNKEINNKNLTVTYIFSIWISPHK